MLQNYNKYEILQSWLTLFKYQFISLLKKNTSL